MNNTAFTLREGEWKVRLFGRVLPAAWNSRGAALAGMEVERRRITRGIEVECIAPPVPSRNYDFQALRRDSHEPGAPIGYGPTPEAAIEDLLEQEGPR